MTGGMSTVPPPPPSEPQTPGAGAARRVASVKGVKGDPAREARIKAALKANIARRKAQARGRDAAAPQDGTESHD